MRGCPHETLTRGHVGDGSSQHNESSKNTTTRCQHRARSLSSCTPRSWPSVLLAVEEDWPMKSCTKIGARVPLQEPCTELSALIKRADQGAACADNVLHQPGHELCTLLGKDIRQLVKLGQGGEAHSGHWRLGQLWMLVACSNEHQGGMHIDAAHDQPRQRRRRSGQRLLRALAAARPRAVPGVARKSPQHEREQRQVPVVMVGMYVIRRERHRVRGTWLHTWPRAPSAKRGRASESWGGLGYRSVSKNAAPTLSSAGCRASGGSCWRFKA